MNSAAACRGKLLSIYKSVHDPLAAFGEPVKFACGFVVSNNEYFPIILEQLVTVFAVRRFPTIAAKRTCFLTVTHYYFLLNLAASRRDFLFFAIDVRERRYAARSIVTLCLGEIVFEDDENFPLVAVRIVYPRLVLKRVTTSRLHFFTWNQAFRFPRGLHRDNVVGRRDLDTEMRQCSFAGKRTLIERQIEGRILHVELRIARPDLARLDAQHVAVKVDALLNITDVDR